MAVNKKLLFDVVAEPEVPHWTVILIVSVLAAVIATTVVSGIAGEDEVAQPVPACGVLLVLKAPTAAPGHVNDIANTYMFDPAVTFA